MGFGNLSAHKAGGWKAQSSRVRRWHERFVNSCRGSSSSPEERLDFFLAFCHNCYALRDWLQNDDVISKGRLDMLMQNTQSLRVCRDIANGSKHLKINMPSVDPDFSIGREYCGSQIPERWFVLAGNDLIDALSLSDECLNAWQAFLQEHNLSM